ncbi:MAG: hypothetical protein A3I66_04495 [Burkholderiales bacterium RIFCSPLOWO2_02_FULL_57_36]|nr:MAG: hypothetical protein A3I66_04495 [Burkholderiales bacterium RIFCSPLOWO2_02_FULL_57_36]
MREEDFCYGTLSAASLILPQSILMATLLVLKEATPKYFAGKMPCMTRSVIDFWRLTELKTFVYLFRSSFCPHAVTMQTNSALIEICELG